MNFDCCKWFWAIPVCCNFLLGQVRCSKSGWAFASSSPQLKSLGFQTRRSRRTVWNPVPPSTKGSPRRSSEKAGRHEVVGKFEGANGANEREINFFWSFLLWACDFSIFFEHSHSQYYHILSQQIGLTCDTWTQPDAGSLWSQSVCLILGSFLILLPCSSSNFLPKVMCHVHSAIRVWMIWLWIMAQQSQPNLKRQNLADQHRSTSLWFWGVRWLSSTSKWR